MDCDEALVFSDALLKTITEPLGSCQQVAQSRSSPKHRTAGWFCWFCSAVWILVDVAKETFGDRSLKYISMYMYIYIYYTHMCVYNIIYIIHGCLKFWGTSSHLMGCHWFISIKIDVTWGMPHLYIYTYTYTCMCMHIAFSRCLQCMALESYTVSATWCTTEQCFSKPCWLMIGDLKPLRMGWVTLDFSPELLVEKSLKIRYKKPQKTIWVIIRNCL